VDELEPGEDPVAAAEDDVLAAATTATASAVARSADLPEIKSLR
jgi:hypothetical protein